MRASASRSRSATGWPGERSRRTRDCGSRVGRGRPLGSFFAAAVAAAAIARYGAGLDSLIAAFTCAVLVVLSVIDVESRRLPNNIVLPSAALVLAARLLTAPEDRATWLGDARRRTIPFGPFLALGTIVAIFLYTP